MSVPPQLMRSMTSGVLRHGQNGSAGRRLQAGGRGPAALPHRARAAELPADGAGLHAVAGRRHQPQTHQ